MESSIAEFLLWMCACEPHPTRPCALIARSRVQCELAVVTVFVAAGHIQQHCAL